MNVLYVTGACLTRNTSANMSHNAFVQGLLENECDVDILMAKDGWGNPDQALPVWEKATYYVFPSVSFADRIRLKLRGNPSGGTNKESINKETAGFAEKSRKGIKLKIRSIGKKAFYTVFKPDPVYPLEKEWLKKAARFQSNKKFDLVISNSSPAASHRLVSELKKSGNISFTRWIQIWEDPWSHDLYGCYPKEIEEEEHYLLREASEIVYVSPLTLMYQKQYFPDCAQKMSCVPLPALKIENDEESQAGEEVSFGYFGDYYSDARDLRPFYNAIKEMGYRCYIYGDTDVVLQETDKIAVSGRVTLDRLQHIQEKTRVLVHLCNLKGGQIPGKIYHYSVTDKPILFILDGTEAEQKMLREYFEPFKRYYFCTNTVDDIKKAITNIVDENKQFSGLQAFLPRNVVKKLFG